MRFYEDTVQQFRTDVLDNLIAEKIKAKFEEYLRHRPSPSEVNSWNNSLRFLKDAIEISGLEDNYIAIEYELPYSERRIDAILFGKNPAGEDNSVIVELKQWSNEFVFDSDNEGNVLVDFGRHKEEHPHPSKQVEGYYYNLKDFKTVFEETDPILLHGCVYCHNYSRGDSEVLFLPKFDKARSRFPIFSRQDCRLLGEYFREKLSKGNGLEVFNRFSHSIIRPSRKLLDHTSDMINKQQIFNLIDEQITAYNAIMHKAKKLSDSKEKSVIIVKGGPGTGKSVIALEVMGELLRKGKNVYHATGSSAFTNTLRHILGVRAQERFKFFYGFTDRKENDVDVIICDEAHRIRRDSSDFRVPAKYKSRNPQVEDLIKPAKLSIFFIDEHQTVRPNELGTVKLIKDSAKKLGVKEENILEYELKAQFRCSGSDSYLQWVERTLGITDSEKEYLTKKDKFEFRIVDSPHELKKIIFEKNREKRNCARIVAGFCWKWNSPRPDGSLVNDVKIGDFEMPWERKNEFWKWATQDSGMEQVGTVYTSQGFEFDYIGIIWGKDLVYDAERQKWEGKPENSYDTMMKSNNTNFTNHLKNVYRVLLSRAHRGCYVYFMDKKTEEFFKSKIKLD